MDLQEILRPYIPVVYKLIGFYIACLVAVFLDLISGIRKSRAVGIKVTHSHGIRKTLDKLSRYFVLLLSASTLDAVTIISGLPEIHNLPILPYVTFVMTIIILIVESYSIWEKDEHKGKYIEAAKIAKEAVKSVDLENLPLEKLAELIANKLENKQDENKVDSSTIINNSNSTGNNDISKQ